MAKREEEYLIYGTKLIITFEFLANGLMLMLKIAPI